MALRRRKRDQRGAAAVEFALIAPIFLLVLFGIMDFGYMINRSSIINNAARDAAREASLGGDQAAVEAAANLTLTGVPGATVSTSCVTLTGAACTVGSAVTGDKVTVKVTYVHEFITPVSMFFSNGVNLSRQATMRVE